MKFFLTLFILLFYTSFLSLYCWTKKVNNYFNQADWEIVNGNYEKSIANYLRGLNLALVKERQRVWDDLGLAYLKTGEVRTAIEYLEKSLEVQPENYNIYLYLAIANLLRNKPNPALIQLQKILKDIYFNDRWIKEKAEFVMFKENGDEVTQLELRRMRKEKGVFLEKKIGRNEMIIHIDAFNERNEGLIYFAMGIAYKMKKEFEKAKENLFVALNRGHSENEIRWQLMDLYIKEGEFQKAEEQVNEILKKEGG